MIISSSVCPHLTHTNALARCLIDQQGRKTVQAMDVKFPRDWFHSLVAVPCAHREQKGHPFLWCATEGAEVIKPVVLKD